MMRSRGRRGRGGGGDGGDGGGVGGGGERGGPRGGGGGGGGGEGGGDALQEARGQPALLDVLDAVLQPLDVPHLKRERESSKGQYLGQYLYDVYRWRGKGVPKCRRSKGGCNY